MQDIRTGLKAGKDKQKKAKTLGLRRLRRGDKIKCGVYGGLAAGLSPSLLLEGCGRLPKNKPNVILITVDTLRADHLGCYGYQRDTSPGIDSFAEDAVLFENCLSHAPETLSSFASIFSGFLPHETRIMENSCLLPVVETLPGFLRSNGYKTAAVVSNFVLRKSKGFENNFMLYDDTMDQFELYIPNNDVGLNMANLKLFLHSLQIFLTDATVKRIFTVLDFDKDERLVWEEIMPIVFPELVRKQVMSALLI